MHDTPDAFAGYSVFFIGAIPDSLISALDSWGLVVTTGTSVSNVAEYDLVIQSAEAPILNAESFYTFLSNHLPAQPAIKTDANALRLLYGEMPEMIDEVKILAKRSFDQDLPVLEAAISSDVAAIILHKMKSCLALTGYIGLQSEIVAWEKIWKYGKGVSHRFPNWKSHKDALYERIIYVSHNI